MLPTLLVLHFFLMRVSYFYGDSPFGRFSNAWFIYLSFHCNEALKSNCEIDFDTNVRLKRNFKTKNEWSEKHMHQRNLCYHKQKEKERGGKKFNEMSKHEIEPEEKTADWRTQDHKMTKKIAYRLIQIVRHSTIVVRFWINVFYSWAPILLWTFGAHSLLFNFVQMHFFRWFIP